MDVFRGQADPAHQIHDFNPGLDNGLFWTVVIPGRSVFVDLDDARAGMHVARLEVEDYHDIVNALQEGPSVPAHVSFRVRWFRKKRREHVHDASQQFDIHAVETDASVEWTASRRGFRFVSGSPSASELEFAEIGRERNGVFF
ncbi:MAG TPA: hypothetical protein VE777_06225 [Gaiellales bacterium]|jgi:hypothetical protein|nr:hypothetical protein [Gaiellales bacterium]